MAKFRFDPKPLGFTADQQDAYVGSPTSRAAFQPCMVFAPGIEAIMEGLRLANVEGFPPTSSGGAAGDIDP